MSAFRSTPFLLENARSSKFSSAKANGSTRISKAQRSKSKTQRSRLSPIEEDFDPEVRIDMRAVHKELSQSNRSHYIKSMFQTQAPLLIITAGPTGSGKSRMPQLVYNMLYGVNSRSTKFHEFYIDDYIANSPEYKSAVAEIIQNNAITNRTIYDDALYKQFDEAYFSGREEWSTKFMSDVLSARDAGNNIVVETTGKKIPTKYVDEFAGYNIVFVYSFAQFDTMFGRNISRFKQQMNAFLRDPVANPAPRIPDMNPESYSKRVQIIESQLGTLRDSCLNITTAGRDSECGDIKNNQRFNLLIVDNTGTNPEIIYDHRKHERFQDRKSFRSMIRSTIVMKGGKGTRRRPRNGTRKKVRR